MLTIHFLAREDQQPGHVDLAVLAEVAAEWRQIAGEGTQFADLLTHVLDSEGLAAAWLAWDVGRPCSSRSANAILPTRFWDIDPLVQHQSPEALLISRFHSVIPSARGAGGASICSRALLDVADELNGRRVNIDEALEAAMRAVIRDPAARSVWLMQLRAVGEERSAGAE